VADQLAVLYMSSLAIRTGTPLPFINPSPLIDRFFRKSRKYGLRVALKDDHATEEGFGKELTLETLQSVDYLRFAVGSSLTLAILFRLDRLMFVTKSIVGECYEAKCWPVTEDEEALLARVG